MPMGMSIPVCNDSALFCLRDRDDEGDSDGSSPPHEKKRKIAIVALFRPNSSLPPL